MASSFNYVVDVGAIQNTPYLMLDTLYTLGEGNARVTGVLKALSAQTDKSLQICLHNEIGYRTSFSNVFTSFVNAFLESEENKAFFEPIYKMVFNGMPVGFGHEKYTLDSDGDVEIYTKSSMLLPVDASNVSRTDSVNQSWSSPDGSLINANEHTVENGVLASHFSISNIDDKWRVAGEMQGKAIEVDLDYTEWLLSGYGSYLATIELMKSEETRANYHMWLSDADPTTATTVGLSETNGSDEGNIQIEMGPITFKFSAEADGIIQKGAMEQGPVKMQLELLKVRGTPAIP